MNFKELDRLIHSNKKRITLTSDVVLEEGEELIYKNGIEIDVDGLTIDGEGHTIDARDKTRIFNVRAQLQVIIVNVVFKNGLHREGGGAISNFSKFLTLGNCIFEHNTANEGGAIYNHAFLKVTNCIFRFNYSRNSPEIYNWDTLILRHCTFENPNEKIIFNLNNIKTEDCSFEPHHVIENNFAQLRETEDEDFKAIKRISEELAHYIDVAERERADACSSSESEDDSRNAVDSINEFIDMAIDSVGTYNETVNEINEFRQKSDENRIAKGTMSFTELRDVLRENDDVILDCDVVFSPGDEYLKDGITFVGPDCTQDDESFVVLKKDLIIDCKGHSIDAKDSARIFTILNKDVTVTFRDISFRNAYFPGLSERDALNDGGGAIYNKSNCRFEFCEFKNNNASFFGGAIYNNGGEMYFYECNFDKNHSQGPAGVIFNHAGGLEFINCIFTNNSAEQAGAVLSSFVGDLKFNGCCFKHNSTKFRGILALAHTASFDFDGSVFLENTVGEGLYIYKTSIFDVI